MLRKLRSVSARALRTASSLLPESRVLPLRLTKWMWQTGADFLDPTTAPPNPTGEEREAPPTVPVPHETAPAPRLAPTEISASDLRERVAQNSAPPLLDIREVHETDRGIIPGALLLPMNAVPGQVADLRSTSLEWVVYCAHGSRSARVAAFLRDQGIQALSLDGGIAAWSAVGGEVRAPKD